MLRVLGYAASLNVRKVLWACEELGIAYRRRVVRSFWVRPTATIFFAAILGMAVWHGSRSADETLARFDPPLVRTPLSAETWWTRDWQQGLPARGGRHAGGA